MRASLRIAAISAALLAPAAVAPPAQAQIRIQFQWGSRDRPLRGQRYESMRELAHELDGRTQHAVQMAAVNASHGGRNERRLLRSMQDLARRASSFHERMDNYQEAPWDLRNEVADLANTVNRVNDRLRNARLFAHAFEDWQAAVNVVQQMEAVLQGRDVRPNNYFGVGEGEDHDHDRDRYRRDENGGYQGNPGYGGYMAGDSLAQLQRLSQRLVTEANQADNQVGQLETDDPNVSAAAGAIHHFAEEARGLAESTNGYRVDPGQVRGRVQELQQDARTADERVRRAGLSQSLSEWDDVISILQQMEQITR